MKDLSKLIEECRQYHRQTKTYCGRHWWAGRIVGLKEVQNMLKKTPLHVKIVVRGGVAEVLKCPKGVRVTIKDYDNQGG